MTRYNAANNWATTLSSAVNSTQETFGVADASDSPTLPFKVTINDEIMNLTAAPSTSTFTATRAAEGTGAAAHDSGAAVENRLTAEVQNDLWDEVDGKTNEAYVDDALENMQGYIYGLTLSNNAVDADNDIDIVIGRARNDDNDHTMVLAAALTKQSDAAWAVGTGNGGMDTGSKPNDGTLHVWLIRRSDTGVVDALFSISATAPTMPTNYDQKRRIGSVLTGATTAPIIAFFQRGDSFQISQILDLEIESSIPTTLTAVTLSVPQGLIVATLLFIDCRQDGSTSIATHGASGSSSQSGVLVLINIGAGKDAGNFTTHLKTNTSAQVQYSDPASRSNRVRIFTQGWIDTRGRLG